MQSNYFYNSRTAIKISRKRDNNLCKSKILKILRKNTSNRVQLHSSHRRKFNDALTNCHPIPSYVFEEISSRVECHVPRWEYRRKMLLLHYKNMPFLLCYSSLYSARKLHAMSHRQILSNIIARNVTTTQAVTIR